MKATGVRQNFLAKLKSFNRKPQARALGMDGSLSAVSANAHACGLRLNDPSARQGKLLHPATGTDEFSGPSTGPNLAQKSENRREALTTAANSSDARSASEHPPSEMRKPRISRGSEHACESMITLEKSTEGGSRTHTPSEGYGILNPARLPFRHSGPVKGRHLRDEHSRCK